jgi:hypothetical protein
MAKRPSGRSHATLRARLAKVAVPQTTPVFINALLLPKAEATEQTIYF